MKALKPFEAPQRANQLTGFYMRASQELYGLSEFPQKSSIISGEKRLGTIAYQFQIESKADFSVYLHTTLTQLS